MIKLEVGIIDNQFSYKYEIGEEKHSSSMDLSADSFVIFTDLLRICSSHRKYIDRELERKLISDAYLEKKAKEDK